MAPADPAGVFRGAGGFLGVVFWVFRSVFDVVYGKKCNIEMRKQLSFFALLFDWVPHMVGSHSLDAVTPLVRTPLLTHCNLLNFPPLRLKPVERPSRATPSRVG